LHFGTKMEIWVIGDVHGSLFTLERLLQRLPSQGRIIFLGDLVDKGRYSREVFELVTDSYETVMGNHEYLMFNYIRDALFRGEESVWSTDPRYGGRETIDSYRGHEETLLRHLELIPTLPKYLEVGEFYLTHGFGLPYYRRRREVGIELLTNRLEEPREGWEEGWESYSVTNIFGHTVYPEPLWGPNYIGIDTGCIYGGRLTAIELGSRRIVSLPLDGRDRR